MFFRFQSVETFVIRLGPVRKGLPGPWRSQSTGNRSTASPINHRRPKLEPSR
jgi:hypothetical protein